MYKKLPLLSFPLTLSGYPYFSLCHLITLALIKAENPHKQRVRPAVTETLYQPWVDKSHCHFH